MCGRVSFGFSYEELTEFLVENYGIDEYSNLDISLPKYNVAPGQSVISVINDGRNNRVGLLKWGFIPSFAKDENIGYKMINARAETIADKPAFKQSLAFKRCVVLVDGYFEWMKHKTEKRPMRIIVKDQKFIALAGIWNSYSRQDGNKVYTCSIVTTNASDSISIIHERMPVILSDESLRIWLNPSIQESSFLVPLLRPYTSNKLDYYEVSSIVNSSSNDVLECILRK